MGTKKTDTTFFLGGLTLFLLSTSFFVVDVGVEGGRSAKEENDRLLGLVVVVRGDTNVQLYKVEAPSSSSSSSSSSSRRPKRAFVGRWRRRRRRRAPPPRAVFDDEPSRGRPRASRQNRRPFL